MMKSPIFLIALLFLTLVSCRSERSHFEMAQDRYPMLKPCIPVGLEEEVLCGTIDVFEDPLKQHGKKIPLKVFLFPSFKKNPTNSVFVEFNGGPGVPNNLLLPYYERGGFSDYFRQLRDVLVVEKRGTGASRISCTALDSITLPIDYYLFNSDLVADCLNEIQHKTDLSQYNTANQVEDLEAVRQSLKIENYDFHGISYGTRVGLELLRRYPESVKSVILTGAVPPKFGLFHFVDHEIERVLQKLIARCKNDSVCNTSFPEFEKQLYSIRKGLKQSPITHSYVQNETKKKHDIIFNDMVFLEMIARIFSSGSKIERLPWIIHEAHTGNFDPLIEANILSYGLAIPLHLSQFCPEEAKPNSAFDFDSLDTLFTKGAAALTEFRACGVWNKNKTPKWLSKPVGDATTPVLIFSGEDDVLTPVKMGNSIQQLFPNSEHIVFKDQGHSYTDWSCWDNLVFQFLETNENLNKLDKSCVQNIERPEFLVPQRETKIN